MDATASTVVATVVAIERGPARERLPTPSKPLRPFVNERIHESSAEPPDFLQGSIRRR